jgi:cytoskeleton protein RodZ
MPPIGETLREARMRQKLDISDVEERTKIRAKYLRALENEEWSLLPGPTFVKTFLRTYAEVVGVDPYLLVEEYRVNHERHDEPEFQPLASSSRARDTRRGSRRPPPSGPPRRGLVVGGLVAALLAFLLALGLLGGEDDGGDGGTDTTPAPAGTDTNRQARKRRPQAQPKPAGVTVRVTPIEPTYACVDTGPGTEVMFEGTLDAARTFRNPKLLRINLGKRSATITANGDPVTVPDSAEPFGLRVTPVGPTDISSADRPCA